MQIKIKVKTILIIILTVCIMGVTAMVYDICQKSHIDEDLIYMIQSIPLTQTEKKSKYNKMMVKIFTAYSYKYDEKYKKSMSKEMKIVYMNKNFELAKLLKFGLYDVPTIHQLESSFDPYLDHDYGETGIGGIKWGTALLAHKLLDYLPESYKRELYFNLNTRQDLKNPIVSLKITYVILWWERRNFRGLEDWYVSIYHWGGFLAKHWDRGKGSIPSSFTINGIKYDTIKYYVSWAELRDAYESGQIEPSRPIAEKWKAYMKKLTHEEINYRRCRRLIKKQRKLLREKKDIEKKLGEKYVEIDRQIAITDKEFKKIGGVANENGWKKQYAKLINLVKKYIRR